MKIIITLLIALTGLQLLTCHLSLWWFISLAARLLFILRRIGAIIPVNRLMITEGVGLAIMLLFYLLFRKGEMPVMRMLLNILFSGLSCAIMIYDDLTKVYDTVDVEE